ncbi:peptidase T [Treponema sp.]
MDEVKDGKYEEVLDRFLGYVRIDSASIRDVDRVPSTQGQITFADLIEKEIEAMQGPWTTQRLADSSLLVQVPATKGQEAAPHAAFLAHLDTYYGLPGAANPKLVICDGKDLLVAPGLSIPSHLVRAYKGQRLVITDGTSLLGADDKAGLAALMTVLAAIAEDGPTKGLQHGPIDFWFTTDEEIGRIGVDVLPRGVGEAWQILWTLDGEELSDISVGDLAIRRAQVIFTGIDAHPCLHGEDLLPAHYASARFVDRLAELPNPMTSSGRESFFQVASIEGKAERAEVFCRMASFDAADLPAMENQLVELAENAAKAYGTHVDIQLSTGSANFHAAVAAHRELIAPAREAIQRRGFTVREKEIRGGTDGGLLALSFPRLAAPDLGNGSRNPHSRTEFLVVEELLALPGIVLDIIGAYVGL